MARASDVRTDLANSAEHRSTCVQLCGGFAVTIDGLPLAPRIRGRQTRLLFSYLVLHRERPVSRAELIEALWPERQPESPDSAINTLVSRLRKVLGEGVICGRSELTLELAADASVDVESAFEAIVRAEQSLAGSRWEDAMSAADVALSVAERGLLAEFEAHWVEEARRRVEEVALRALECLAACGLGLGGARLSTTERAAQRLIEAAPYRETGYRYLMQALAERGRVAEALQVFDDARVLLQAQLGVSPSAGLRSLHAGLLSETVDVRSDRVDPLAARLNPSQAAQQPPIALPPALLARDSERFVGRDEHLERLWRLYEQVRAGARQVAFVRGEPGIGKTRLVTELALRAHADGAVVLYGRCDEDPLLSHQPFVEALQDYVGTCPLAELCAQVGPSSGELRRLVPELAERVADLAQPLAGDPQGERYRLFEAVIGLLCRAAEVRPVVLVLDDLHWADKPTLLLLKQLARRTHTTSLLVLGTYRDAHAEPGHPLSEMLADVGREPGFERLLLGPLDPAAVARLVISHAGEQASEIVERVCRDTEGNPFFVVEMLRHLAQSGVLRGSGGEAASDLRAAALGLPEGVKDIIGRRIACLSPATQQVLWIAAVAGRRFTLEVVSDVSDLDEEQLVESLDEAVRARVIDELTGPIGHYSFTHALIRETIYSGLTGTRRALLHRRMAVSLEALHRADLDAVSAELAHHFAHAGSAGDLGKAIEYGTRAGDGALAGLAYEQAATHYRQAVALIESGALPTRQATRCDLLIAEGEAERQSGDPAYRATLLAGARLAQELGDAARLTKAALANNRGFFSAMAGVDEERVSVLRAALNAQGAQDSAARAALLAHLAIELAPDPDWQRRARLSDEALDIARRLGDARALARTLNFRYVALWGPRTLAERLANTHEATMLAERLEDPILSFQAARFGAHAAMEAGDLALADRTLEHARALDAQLRQPIIHWYFATTRAKRTSISGSPAEAEQLARDAFEIGRRVGQPDAGLWLALQLFVSGFVQSTLASTQPSPGEAAEVATRDTGTGATASRSIPLLVAALHAATASEAGRADEARRRFDALMADDLSELPYDWMALLIPVVASVACARLGDVRRAGPLYAMLEPYAGQFVDGGPSWFGAATHHLANLAATLGRPDEADALFAAAVASYNGLGAEAWLRRARLDRSRVKHR